MVHEPYKMLLQRVPVPESPIDTKFYPKTYGINTKNVLKILCIKPRQTFLSVTI